MFEGGVFKCTKAKQFREADADGYIGLKAYLDYFQDVAGGYMHLQGRDNTIIHERYGAAWLYLKYHIKLFERTDYENDLDIECWIEKTGHPAGVTHDMEIREAGRLLAVGKLESCLIDMESKRIVRPSAIDLDPELSLDRHAEGVDFSRLSVAIPPGEPVYEHVVRYSDLDNNDHVNNLRYIPLMQDAFDDAFHREHVLEEMEIQYKKQCLFGEKLSIYKSKEDDLYRVLAVKEDGSTAACALMRFRDKEGGNSHAAVS